MADNKIVMYGTSWCGDCYRSRNVLEKNNIEFEWVDIDLDREASEFVKQVNNGNRSVPTIIFPEGDKLVEPSRQELEDRLGLP